MHPHRTMGTLPSANPTKIKKNVYDVPGPGSYQPVDQSKAPQYVIKLGKTEARQKMEAPAIGPQTYSPHPPIEWNKKEHPIKLSRTGKGSKSMQQLATLPAPNHYNILGEFDFRDPQNPEKLGKLPKFAFGQKTNIKS